MQTRPCLDWTPVELPKVNTTDGELVELDAATRVAITDRNALDIRLFEYVMRTCPGI